MISSLLLSALLLAQDPAATPEPRALCVLNKFEATVSVLDAASGEIVETIPVGVGPHEAATSPDGNTVVVCNYGQRAPGETLSVIDMKTLAVTDTIELDGYHRPHGIQFLADGKHVVVTAEAEQKLLIVDLEEKKVEQAIETRSRASHMVALDPEQARAYVANIGSGSMTVIDLKSAEHVADVETGAGAEGIAVHPTRPEVWVSNRAADTVSVVDTKTLEVKATIECGRFPIRVQITPDGRQAIVSCAQSGDVAWIDVEKREVVARTPMNEEGVGAEERDGRLFGSQFEGAVPVGVLVPPHGRIAYVANTNADVVTVLDVAERKIVGRLRAGREPDGLAWAKLHPRPAKEPEEPR